MNPEASNPASEHALPTLTTQRQVPLTPSFLLDLYAAQYHSLDPSLIAFDLDTVQARARPFLTPAPSQSTSSVDWSLDDPVALIRRVPALAESLYTSVATMVASRIRSEVNEAMNPYKAPSRYVPSATACDTCEFSSTFDKYRKRIFGMTRQDIKEKGLPPTELSKSELPREVRTHIHHHILIYCAMTMYLCI
jgi:hypothetical protein